MHFVLSTLASLLAASAAPLEARQVNYPVVNSSQPFHLQLSSRNRTLNGSYLFAAHAGAAIESFVPTKNISLASPFNFNTTDYSYGPGTNITGQPGVLSWTLVGGNFIQGSAAKLVLDYGSDIAALKLYPGNETATQFAFDGKDTLNIPYYNSRTQKEEALKRFYICKLYTTGYQYTSLGFKLGSGSPTDRTCSAVTVKRVFL